MVVSMRLEYNVINVDLPKSVRWLISCFFTVTCDLHAGFVMMYLFKYLNQDEGTKKVNCNRADWTGDRRRDQMSI
jgi:hypothetical protein